MTAEDLSNMISLEGRVALISGGSRGIGRAIAETFATAGASVVVMARKPAELAETAEALEAMGANVLTHQGSQASADDTEAAVAASIETFGRLDIVVANAAVNPWYGPMIEIDRSAVRKIFEVNVEGPLLLAQAAWGQWMEEHGGTIINVSSGGGMRTVPGLGTYGLSKAALIHMTKQLAMELGPKVRVNTLTPGLVKTDFAKELWETQEAEKSATLPLRRLGMPNDLASAALFLASDASGWVTGANLVVDGGRMVSS